MQRIASSSAYSDVVHTTGEAAGLKGFEGSQRYALPEDGNIRVNLTAQERLTFHWLAHFGWQHTIADIPSAHPFASTTQ